MRRMTKREFLEQMEEFLERHEREGCGTCPGTPDFRYSSGFSAPRKPPYRDACWWCRKLFSNPKNAELSSLMFVCPCLTFGADTGIAMANAREVLDKLNKKEA